MSCKDCEDFQETTTTSYYRWKNANIEIRGCAKHLREIFNALNDAQREDRISLCLKCQCMTKTVDDKCGKCKENKP